MGLFDFVSNIGEKIFSDGDDKAAEKIKERIESDNPGISNLDIQLEDGVAKISGDVDNSTALEKAVLIAGNIDGVSAVELAEISGAEPAADVEYYEIQKGDSLWKIASHFYNDGNKYTVIFEENKEVIKDPDKIYPGQKIRIPTLSAVA